MSGQLEDKSVDDICEYLEGKGFSDSVTDVIKGNGYPRQDHSGVYHLDIMSCVEQELDGNAIAMGLASSPGPDWIKDIVPVLGVRLKVHHALRALYNANSANVVSLVTLLPFCVKMCF